MQQVIRYTAALFVLCVGISSDGLAQQSPDEALRSLSPQAGAITLGSNLATLNTSTQFRYLNPEDTKILLVKIWGNPPSTATDTLGTLIPTQPSLMSVDGWAAVMRYDPTGNVSDSDAEAIDYDQLMLDMKNAVQEASKERVKNGYPALELLGWARKPYYDKATKKLFWAKRLRFGDSDEETLNYEIRILGRKGVLDLNLIASMSALPAIDSRINSILSLISFNQGNTYAEFDPKIDEAAAYGIAGLVAGGILTKAGFFKGLIVLLLASKKLAGIAIIGFFAACWGAIKRFFSGNKSTLPPPT